MFKTINVAISGVQGYSGQALMKLINSHPYLNLTTVYSRQTQTEVYQQLPNLKRQQIPVYPPAEISKHVADIDVLFLATPAQVSLDTVTTLIDKDLLIIDLSGGFRLPAEDFHFWYGLEHTAPTLINNACYGLTPWVTTQPAHKLIANPGCYATCALMSLLPLVKAQVLNQNTVIIDAKSGLSGAGKQVKAELMFCEMANNFLPYKIGKHQHIPEIKQALKSFGGQDLTIRLTTALLPLHRGIAMTIYAEAQAGLSDAEIAKAIYNAYHQAYQGYPLVYYQELGQEAALDNFILALNQVVDTPNCHIGYFVSSGQITLFACLDNLLKGAASQAVENLNAVYGLPLQTGLLSLQETL
ncbi:N-acetyl-gamma-glutamyl-phosphate reductase [Legionella sp. D16C41]|uniref:N-acetyl-gamma-glutamyl-phosphate reductase n=1 Tax=Legionella sp. D16C41 TaxID=3402688 RepID=UPI003AF7EAA3